MPIARRSYSPVSSSRTIIRRDSVEVVDTHFDAGPSIYARPPSQLGYAPYDLTPQASPSASPILGHQATMPLSRQGSSLFGAIMDAHHPSGFDRYDSAVHLDGRSSFGSASSAYFAA